MLFVYTNGMKPRLEHVAIGIITAIALTLLLAGSVSAQGHSGLKTLDDYLNYASDHSPAIQSAYYSWRAGQSAVGYAGALSDPVFTFGQFIQNVETRVGPQERRYGIRQSFPWFGILGAKKSAARFQADAAFQSYESRRLMTFYKIKKAYYEYYLLGRESELLKDNIELLSFWESVIRTKYEVGLANHPDLIKTQIERSLLENRLAELTDKFASSEQSIRSLLDLPDLITLPIPDTLTLIEASISTDSTVLFAASHNPDIAAAMALVDKSRELSDLANKSSFPDFAIMVDYIETGPALNPTMPESGKDPWSIGVSLSLPIWFGKNKAQRSEASARVNASKYSAREAQNTIRDNITRTVYEYNDAVRKISLYRDDIIPQTEQLLNVTFAAYQSGASDILSVIDAQRQMLDASLKYEQARVRQAAARAGLEMLTGEK